MDGETEEQVGEEREMKDASTAEALVSRKRDKSVEVEEANKRPRLVETGGESFSEEFVVEIPANDVADR